MERKMKLIMILLIMAVVLLFIVYSVFFGLPWKKASTAKKLETYVEEKYDIQVAKKETYYNFKNNSYGAKFVSKTPHSVTFLAETNGEQFIDYYPEAVWKRQLSNDIKPEIQKVFSHIENITIEGTYGLGEELGIQQKIPAYQSVNGEFIVLIHLTNKWDREVEEKVIDSTYQLVQVLQEKEINNVSIHVQGKESKEGETAPYIDIPSKKIRTIQEKSDIETYVTKE